MFESVVWIIGFDHILTVLPHTRMPLSCRANEFVRHPRERSECRANNRRVGNGFFSDIEHGSRGSNEFAGGDLKQIRTFARMMLTIWLIRFRFGIDGVPSKVCPNISISPIRVGFDISV